MSFDRGLKRSVIASVSRCAKFGEWRISQQFCRRHKYSKRDEVCANAFQAISIDRLSKGVVIGKEGRFAIDSMQMSIEFTSV